MSWPQDRFSRRHSLDPTRPNKQIYEEAPDWMRRAFFNNILDDLTYIDGDTRYPNEEARPLGIKELSENICVLLRKEPDEHTYDSWTCKESLKEMILSCEWYFFFDIVERVAYDLLTVEASRYSFDGNIPSSWVKRFGYEEYRQRLNELFTEESIGWRLDDTGQLQREIPKALSEKLQSTDKNLDEFSAAREHYRKAVKYTQSRSPDPENAIKEVVSAIESIGKRFYPSAKTLGDILKQARRQKDFPEMMLSMIQKFYDFCNAEPAIRHGFDATSAVKMEDAEFCLHVGTSFIRYLLAKKQNN